MANMFQETIEGFEFVPSEDQWTGKRRFLEDPDGTFEEGTTLPEVGDADFPAQNAPYDTPPANFKVRKVTFTNYSNVAGEERQLIVDYSTKDINFTNVPDPDDDQENLQVSGEFVLLGGLSGNAGATKFAESGATLDNKLRIYIPTATYTFSESQDTFALAIATFTGKIGKVKDDDARWLMTGATISEFINDDGDNRFQVVRAYSYKDVQAPAFAGGAADQGWQLVWDPKKAHWDVTAPLMYGTVAFTDAMPAL